MAHDIETVRNALKSVVPELQARANVVVTVDVDYGAGRTAVKAR